VDRSEVRWAWDEVAETCAARRDPDGSDAALIDDLLAELSGERPEVPDVGRGDGARTLANLPPGSVGLDRSRRGLDLARETVPGARLVQGELSTLPFAAAGSTRSRRTTRCFTSRASATRRRTTSSPASSGPADGCR
jgi:hypothetical protein